MITYPETEETMTMPDTKRKICPLHKGAIFSNPMLLTNEIDFHSTVYMENLKPFMVCDGPDCEWWYGGRCGISATPDSIRATRSR